MLRRAYEAFNARDIGAALELMHPDVDWPNGMEGGRVHGHAAVREYWSRQFGKIDSKVEPEAFTAAGDDTIAVEVHQVVRDLDGNLVSDGHIQHVYTFREGLVSRMEIREK